MRIFITLLFITIGLTATTFSAIADIDDNPFDGTVNPEANSNLSNAQNCREAVTKNLAIEHRLFRSTIFGEPTTEDAPVGHVTFNTGTASWIKTADDNWQSLAKEFEGTTWSDAQMQANTRIPARKGVFETRNLLTSDLIPYITNNVRTFDCRMRLYCEAALLSSQMSMLDSNIFAAISSGIPLTISGCEEVTFPVVKSCLSKQTGIPQEALTDAVAYCQTIRTELYEREKSLMILSTEYDASYRSTLQFAGDFDLFLEQIRWPMTNTIRQVSTVIGALHRVPCFVASCEDGINYPDKLP